MSNDAQRLPDMSLGMHAIWSTPVFVIIAVFLLVRLVGAAAIAGIVLLVLMIPLQGFLATKQMGLQRAQMKQTESRVKVINEVLQVSKPFGGGGWVFWVWGCFLFFGPFRFCFIFSAGFVLLPRFLSPFFNRSNVFAATGYKCLMSFFFFPFFLQVGIWMYCQR